MLFPITILWVDFLGVLAKSGYIKSPDHAQGGKSKKMKKVFRGKNYSTRRYFSSISR